MIYLVFITSIFLLAMILEIIFYRNTRQQIEKLTKPHLSHISKRKSQIERLYMAYLLIDKHKIVVHRMYLQSLSNGHRLVQQVSNMIVQVIIPLLTFIFGLSLGGLQPHLTEWLAAFMNISKYVYYFMLSFILFLCVHYVLGSKTKELVSMHQVVINQVLEEKQR